MGTFRYREEEGFSLVEMIVVVIILGILAVISIVVYLAQRESAASASAKQSVRNVSLLSETMRQEGQPFTSDLADYRDESSAYTYLPGSNPSLDPTQVSVFVPASGDLVVLAARARESCWYMRVDTRGQRTKHTAAVAPPATTCRGSEFETGAGSDWP